MRRLTAYILFAFYFATISACTSQAHFGGLSTKNSAPTNKQGGSSVGDDLTGGSGIPSSGDFLGGDSDSGNSQAALGSQGLMWQSHFQLLESYSAVLRLPRTPEQNSTFSLEETFRNNDFNGSLRVLMNPSTDPSTLTPLSVLASIELANRGCIKATSLSARNTPNSLFNGFTVSSPNTMFDTPAKRTQFVESLLDRTWGLSVDAAHRQLALNEMTSTIVDLLSEVQNSETIMQAICTMALSSAEMTLK